MHDETPRSADIAASSADFWLPRIRVEVPRAESIFTRVFLDDQELRGVTRVQFDTGSVGERPFDKTPLVTVTFLAELMFDGVASDLRSKIERLRPVDA